MKTPVTLQINLAPGDYPHAKLILPHQLEMLAKQVDEIILTVDTKQSSGRFSEGWLKHEELLYTFLNEEIRPKYPVQILPVNYGRTIKTKVAEYFFGSKNIPDKDFRGGPFYSYFFGLFHACSKLVLHLDSDIFLGGGSQTWVEEAKAVFKKDPRYLVVSPHPGPPHPSGILIDQTIIKEIKPYTYELSGMSTRIFMTDKSIFTDRKLSLKKPALKGQVKAVIQGNHNAELPEILIRDFMQLNDFKRLDFLGQGKGLWSLHPPFRTKSFYDNLGNIIDKINGGDLPSAQYGFYDIVDELCDWKEGWENLKKNRWWKGMLNGESNK
ncbi:MAG: hypothetical protein JWQ66_2661 [Mucilaginibacter sp.]|nr:hypothetical protein [Mucilaginibacter sp.]